MLELLYEDRQILVVWKPAGVESQAARGLNADMVSEIRRHIHNFSPGSAEPYVGVIHRLDKPVSGIMVYAKDKKAAAALSRQIENGSMKKQYLAVVCGKVPQNVDKFVDYLLKDKGQNQSRIVDKGVKGAKRAELLFRELEKAQDTDNRWLALTDGEAPSDPGPDGRPWPALVGGPEIQPFLCRGGQRRGQHCPGVPPVVI